jgi:hypothetical protein
VTRVGEWRGGVPADVLLVQFVLAFDAEMEFSDELLWERGSLQMVFESIRNGWRYRVCRIPSR